MSNTSIKRERWSQYLSRPLLIYLEDRKKETEERHLQCLEEDQLEGH